MPIPQSERFIADWCEFQFGDAAKEFILDCWSWLSRAETKKGGVYVQGPSNSGKSYIMHSLIENFVEVGIFKPKKNYIFNFDDCADKQIVLADEYWHGPDDTTTIETLKEILAGNTMSVVVKNKPQQVVYPTPFCFISNKEPFNMDDDQNGENPWPSRLYYWRTKIYEHWTDTTRNQLIHPFAWLNTFKAYGLLE